MRTFRINMIPTGSPLYIRANQFETGDEWKFQLFYDGERYSIPSGATAKISGSKPDKTAYEYSCTIENNEIVAVVTEQMTAAHGWSTVELLVASGSLVLYSANFIVDIEPAAVQVPLADTTLPLSITAQDGTVYVQSDLEEATEQMITLAAQQQYQQDLASGVAQRVVEQYAGSTLAGSRQTVKAAIDELNSNKVLYVDVSGTISTTQYGAMYYVDVDVPAAARGKTIVALTPVANLTNRFTSCQIVSNGRLRIFSDSVNVSCTIRIAYTEV